MNRRVTLGTGLAIALALGGCGFVSPARSGLDPAGFNQLRAQAVSQGRVNVVVEYGSPAHLTTLSEAGFDLWGVENGKAKGTASPRALDAMKQLDLKIESSRKLGNTFDKGYKTVDQVEADLKALAAKYPGLAQVADYGDSWEKTQGKKGHDLYVLKIGKGDTTNKPGVIYFGDHHAREIVTPEVVLDLAHLLLEGYGKDPELTSYVDNRAIYLAPVVNPDGHVLCEKGADQRKNTNTVTGGKDRIGVDLNRNFGFKWGTGGASSDPDDDTYKGKSAFSEPETQAVRDLVRSRKFTFLMTYHSFSNLVLWPWGYQDAPPPDKRLPAVGTKLASFNHYTGEQSKDLYRTSGDTTDWAFGELGVLAYTTEIGTWNDGFDPPYSSMPKFWNENKPGALYLLKIADNPAAVFGTELTSVQVSGGQVQVAANAPLQKIEVYTTQPGTGMQLAANGMHASVALPTEATLQRQVLMVRAQDAHGNWGPATAVWSR